MQISSPRSKKKLPTRSPSTFPPPLSSHVPTPHIPHPTFELEGARVVLPVPFLATNDHKDQGYGTQEDEDRTTQAAQRSPGKHMHWGGVEAQPAYELPHDGEAELAVEHSPPFSRLLLPATPSTEPEQEVRPERATRLTTRQATPPALQKPMQKFEQGIYTMTDICWGMALDLSSADIRSPIALGQGAHGRAGAAAQVDRGEDGRVSGWAQGKTRALCVSSYTLPIFALGCDATSVLVECG